MVLEDEGYAVETAANGAEALEQLRHLPAPSAVLPDLLMPVMNGWRFLQLVNSGRPPDFPAVVVSAVVPPKPENATSCLRKPVEIDALLATVALYASPQQHQAT